jgi:hypothetical protein
MVERLGQSEPSIQSRIDWAVGQRYIAADEEAVYIAQGQRTLCEQGYLELVAKHFDNQAGRKTVSV